MDVDNLDASPNTAAYENSIIEQLVQQSESYTPQSECAPKVPPHFLQDKLNLTNSLVRLKLESINHEISELDHRMQNIQLVKTDKRKPPQLPHIPAPPESDTEHIYETIPESVDSELEPIYSCPYESGDSNLIEHWLKTQDNGWNQKEKTCKSKEGKSKTKSLKSNSSGEEHENSSSAYNTGGSCNSNPLTLELACSLDSKQKDTYRSTLVLCPPNETTETSREVIGSCDLCKQQISTKHKKTKSSKNNSPQSPTTKAPFNPVHILSDTMYTNVANLQQTMLLQQQLFRQALGQQITETPAKPSPSFTSHSLNQYQFANVQVSTPQQQHRRITANKTLNFVVCTL